MTIFEYKPQITNCEIQFWGLSLSVIYLDDAKLIPKAENTKRQTKGEAERVFFFAYF